MPRQPKNQAPPPDHPWERLPGETERMFLAYRTYRDMGPTRTHVALAAQLGCSTGHLERLSSRHGWVKRNVEWDRHNDQVEQQARDRENAKRSAEWERRRLQAMEDTYQLAESIRGRCVEMLAHPLTKRKASQDGKTVLIEPARWTMGTVASMAKLYADLAALAVGEALDDPFDPTTATDDECREYAQRMLERRKVRRAAPGAES